MVIALFQPSSRQSGGEWWKRMVEASVRIVAAEDLRAEVLDVLHRLKGPTEVHTGCRMCRILQDADNASVLTYLVRWDSVEDLRKHLQSDQFRMLLPYIDLSVEVPEIDVCEIEQVGGIEFLLTLLTTHHQLKSEFNE